MDSRPVCLITGGASGIGEASVRLFAARGYQVIIGDVQTEKADGIVAELGASIRYERLDVRREEDFDRACTNSIKNFGRLDVVVNNAGVAGALGSIADLTAEDFEYASSILFRSVFFGCKHAARVMKPRRQGAIVNTASIAGVIGGHGPHIYGACKAAVALLTQSLALELIEDGIRVNAVNPGNVETPILTGVRDGRWLQRIDKIAASLKDDQPIGRCAQPSEIAEAIFLLASSASSFVTGQCLAVDGGLLAGRPWRLQPEHFRKHAAARPID